MKPGYSFTRISHNGKTGPIPVTISDRSTCPSTCPLKGNGCYAENFPLSLHWDNASLSFDSLLESIRKLPSGQLWRHNQAGDLPGQSDRIHWPDLSRLINANGGRRGFTYTHKPVLDHAWARHNRESIAVANALGFTINLSADNLAHADRLHELDIAPVVTILPAEQTTNTITPGGRRVVVCPAYHREQTTCSNCGLCQKAARSIIVGFPAHGARSRAASAVARSS